MLAIFEKFGELLDARFGQSIATTEDSVRYTFFAALLMEGITPDQVVLEFPHPSIDRAKIDTWLPSYEEKSIAIEFKYDREPPGGKNQPKTKKAGHVFKDLRRQILIAGEIGVRSYFVYVTSEEMAVYFCNPNNGYSGLWDLNSGEDLIIDEEYLSNKPKTFLNTVGGNFQAEVVGVFSRNLARDNYLRVYSIGPCKR